MICVEWDAMRKVNYAAYVNEIMSPTSIVSCGNGGHYAEIILCDGHILAVMARRKILTKGQKRRYYIYNIGGSAPEEVFMAKRQNPKAEALAHSGTLNPHPERVRDTVFLENDFFDPRDLLQVKYEMLRKKRIEGETVTKVAAAFGFSRPSVYQTLRAFDDEGLSGLLPERRGPKQAHKLTGAVMTFIQETLRADASLNAMDLVRKVQELFGVQVHRRSIERALVRCQKKGR